jgi:hypothetical protein
LQIEFFWIISPGNGWLMLQRLGRSQMPAVATPNPF